MVRHSQKQFSLFLAILVVSISILGILTSFVLQNQSKSASITSKPTSSSPDASSSATPTASISATPKKPLSFTEMNNLYGPCATLPVLMYHHIQDLETAKQNNNTFLTVTPDTFEKHLAYLNDKGYTSIAPAELIAFFNSGQSLPKKAILLTFDDAYSDFATYAAPLLTRYSIKATVFVPTGLIENNGYLSWSSIQSLAGQGFYFANHTWSHQNMSTSSEKIKKEIDTAQTQLEQHGQNPDKIFAYPYGTISQTAINHLSSSGFQLAFTTINGRTQCAKKRFNLTRIRIGNGSLANYGL